jgi:hypothetical protein
MDRVCSLWITGGFGPPWTRGQGATACTSSHSGTTSERDGLGSAAHWLSLEVDGEGEEDVPMSGEPSPESGRRRGSDTMTLKGSVEWSSVVARLKEKGGMWGK